MSWPLTVLFHPGSCPPDTWLRPLGPNGGVWIPAPGRAEKMRGESLFSPLVQCQSGPGPFSLCRYTGTRPVH